MKKMNRRTFVKDLGIASAASALCMAGAVSAGADETGDFIAGKYQATVNGHNAPFTVTCTFTERALADIDVTGNLESRGVGAWALGKLSRSIIANQSLNVDTIAGATISSFALLLGVEDCAAQAGADAYLLDREAEHVVPEAEYTADVCVVGGGGAGCVAAIRAAQAGAKVVIMDKVDIIGGSTNVSGGALNAVDPYRQEKQGIEDSVEQFYESTFTGGGEKGDPELIHFLTDHAMESVEWLENLGCAFKLQVSSATGSLGERSHYTAKPAGVGYTDTFRDYFDLYPDKVTIVGGTKAVELITDANGAVIGVRGEHKSGSEVVVHAASVVLATGGFGANIEFRQSVNDGVWSEVTLDSGIGCTNINPCAQGDGLGLAEAVGAELIGLSDIQLHHAAPPVPAL
ncbi:MAG: FAD-binding protein [Coriobacteriales bacterium]|nr:FAD-binding protein [Coriobacteriales bacterium]